MKVSEFAGRLFSYIGKIVVITGGAGLIARYLAQAYLKAGADVVLWDLDAVELEEVKDGLSDEDGIESERIHTDEVDCGDEQSVESALGRITGSVGIPDLLLNGVGGNRGKSDFIDLDVARFEKILRLNLIAGMLLPTKIFTREWIACEKQGTVINIASMAAYLAWSGVWAYDAAKAAVMNLTKGAAAEFAEYGIRVNSISPGVFVGKQNHDLLIEQDRPLVLTDRGRKITDRTPMGRFGDYRELQGACLFLGSNKAAGFVTGIDVPVDGGFLVNNI